MAKNEVDDITQRAIEKGGLLVKLYFDMHTDAQTDLQAIMADLVNNKLLKAKGVLYCFGSIDEPIKDGDMFTTSAIVTALIGSLEDAMNVVFTFAPAAIEVIKPEGEYRLKQSELQNTLVSLSSISMNYSEYILKRIMSQSDYEKIKGDIKAREELGKRIMGKNEEHK
jgi:hypothetical protein